MNLTLRVRHSPNPAACTAIEEYSRCRKNSAKICLLFRIHAAKFIICAAHRMFG
jgi:hypothetical protein